MMPQDRPQCPERHKRTLPQNIPVLIITGASAVTGVDIRSGDQHRNHLTMTRAELRGGFTDRAELQSRTDSSKPIDPPALIAKIEDLLR
jgi:hypothetical protein